MAGKGHAEMSYVISVLLSPVSQGKRRRVMSERPRRSARPTARQPVLVAETSKNEANSSTKVKKQSDKLFDIDYLLKDSKSHLTRIDISVSAMSFSCAARLKGYPEITQSRYMEPAVDRVEAETLHSTA